MAEHEDAASNGGLGGKETTHDLKSLLAAEGRDFLVRNNGDQVLASELVGKNIFLYFSAQWFPPCRAFLPKLIEAYHKIKEKDTAFEIIFVSSDRDESTFDEFFLEMPWLALPFGDKRKNFLNHTFKIYGMPYLVAIGTTGKTITTEVSDLVIAHGAAAYPFTTERLQELEAEIEEMAKGWPEKLKHELHDEHELVKSQRRSFICDRCIEEGSAWSFYCNICDFNLHPNCALENGGQIANDGDGLQHKEAAEGYICDDEVCYKV